MPRKRIPEMDGFRVLMIFIVSWFHIWQQSWLTPYIGSYSLDYLVRAGYMPVDATILLSGFLLFLPYVEASRAGLPLPDTRSFYRRRAARVVPSFVFVNLLMLFLVAIPQHRYAGAWDMAGDLAAHFTFTFTWFRRTYLGTPLSGSAWTVAIEVQMYALFPFIARAALKKPGAVLAGLALLSAYFRGWAVWSMKDYGMVVNQLISFFDVYALGMACAIAYRFLRDRFAAMDAKEGGRRGRLIREGCFTAALAAGLVLFFRVLRVQARAADYPAIQSGQMIRRPVFAAVCALILLALPFSWRAVRAVFGNPVTRFLSTVSMNYYLLHQNVAVLMRTWNVPWSELALPNQAGDRVWQVRYTWLAFGLSLAAAVAVTFLIEKPFARLILGKRRRA